MHAVLVTIGSIGDLLPFIALGRALSERGHTVTLCTNREYETVVRSRGLGFKPVWSGRSFAPALHDPHLWQTAQAWAVAWRDMLAPAMKGSFAAIASLAAAGDCTVFATPMAFGARLAQEKLGVKLCSVYLAPHTLNLRDDEARVPYDDGPDDSIYRLLLDQFRQELGLAPVERICGRWMHSPQGGVALFPPWFCLSAPPAAVTFTDFVFFDGALMPIPAGRLKRFLAAGTPPVVFTPGTGMCQGQAFFQASLQACAALNRRAILLTRFSDQLPGELPESALHLEYVPLHMVLGRAAAFVHHGGIGTSAQALRAGVPQLPVPAAFDQFDNAQRIERLGVGICLPATQYCAQMAGDRLQRLIDSPIVNQRCAQLAQRFAGDTGTNGICAQLESWAERITREKSSC